MPDVLRSQNCLYTTFRTILLSHSDKRFLERYMCQFLSSKNNSVQVFQRPEDARTA